MQPDRLYIFDLAAGWALAVEDNSNIEAPLGRTRLEGLLAHLASGAHTTVLRAFAREAARVAGAAATNKGLREILSTAEAAIADPDFDVSRLEAVRSEYRGTASAAGAVGLAHRASNAASFLAAYAACHPDAHAAATEAARMAYLYGELSRDGLTADATTQVLLDWLLDHLP